jgi:hypothetical protein
LFARTTSAWTGPNFEAKAFIKIDSYLNSPALERVEINPAPGANPKPISRANTPHHEERPIRDYPKVLEHYSKFLRLRPQQYAAAHLDSLKQIRVVGQSQFEKEFHEIRRMPSNQKICQMNKLFNSEHSVSSLLEVEPTPEGTLVQDCDGV